jgi:hypothetical protein
MRVPPDARPGNKRKSPVRAYLRLLRTPKQNTWYGDWDPRSWRVVAHQVRAEGLGLADVRQATAIVRSGRGGGRYLSTMPRSGTNWMRAMLECGLSLSQGFPGTFRLEPSRAVTGDDEWVFDGPRFGWPAQPQSLASAIAHGREHPVGDPTYLFSHDPLEAGMVDYRRARPVVTIRDPLPAARSLVRKEGIDWLQTGTRLYYCVNRVERFFSVWEQRIADPDVAARTLVLRYEDLRADPVAALVRISEHWDLGVDAAVWAQAAAACSWEAMSDVASDRPDTMRISIERTEIPEDMDAAIREQCADVGTSFGYPLPPRDGA